MRDPRPDLQNWNKQIRQTRRQDFIRGLVTCIVWIAAGVMIIVYVLVLALAIQWP